MLRAREAASPGLRKEPVTLYAGDDRFLREETHRS